MIVSLCDCSDVTSCSLLRWELRRYCWVINVKCEPSGSPLTHCDWPRDGSVWLWAWGRDHSLTHSLTHPLTHCEWRMNCHSLTLWLWQWGEWRNFGWMCILQNPKLDDSSCFVLFVLYWHFMFKKRVRQCLLWVLAVTRTAWRNHQPWPMSFQS